MTLHHIKVICDEFALDPHRLSELLGVSRTTVYRWLDPHNPARPKGIHARLLWLLATSPRMVQDALPLWDAFESVDRATNPYYVTHPRAKPVTIARDNPLYDHPENLPTYQYTMPLKDYLFIKDNLLRISGLRLSRLLGVTQPTVSHWTTQRSSPTGIQSKMLYLLAAGPFLTYVPVLTALQEMRKTDKAADLTAPK
jgi:DNA-binding transcriptional regulator YiaG